MATHSFSSRHYSSPLPFSATLSNSKADRIKAFLLPRIAYHRKAFRLKSIPLPLSACPCFSVANQIWTKPFLFAADLCNSKALRIKAFLLLLQSIPFQSISSQIHSVANPVISVAVSSRCLPLPFRGLSSRLCGMQFIRISMLFPAEQFPRLAAHLQSLSMPIHSTALPSISNACMSEISR